MRSVHSSVWPVSLSLSLSRHSAGLLLTSYTRVEERDREERVPTSGQRLTPTSYQLAASQLTRNIVAVRERRETQCRGARRIFAVVSWT